MKLRGARLESGEFVPFKRGIVYNTSNNTLVKIGDIFRVNQLFGKNPFLLLRQLNLTPWGSIGRISLYPLLRWELKKNKKPYIISFSAVDKLIDGNSEEVKNFLKGKNHNIIANVTFFRKIWLQHNPEYQSIIYHNNVCNNFSKLNVISDETINF